ncbi:DUF2851 family protein [Dysgonomonas sp. 25]|uniref:DUF2851 family protein n=1 Tax=Dysgonomonas sp. 25 TaxID=2302933 RepID=UPI0013D860D0|nr:DUF2851 family protein [Dysgonomonas sp. 25]NDV69874.1 DUF2851 family protein [Dysgonomonas sp. 25]
MENILHYVWKFRLYTNDMQTTDGLPIEVIDPGIHNTDAGPDFFNAKVKINGELWAGNIEIHSASSDWVKHKHHTDKAYNSVVLHVVEKANDKIYNEEKRLVPQCELKYPQHIKDNFAFLEHANTDIPCHNFVSSMSPIHITSWMSYLLFERLERKTKHIFSLLERFNNSWEDVFFVLLTRNFGFGLNSDSFERLALSFPFKCIQKQGDNIKQIEAILFGQAGMLNETANPDAYFLELQKEYNFLRTKYTLTPLDAFIFKKLRSRPTAFPQIRIAQLAALLYTSQGLFSKIISCEDVGRIRLMFHVNASEYWQTHYTFGIASEKKSKYLGDASLDILLINTVAPMLFAYGKTMNNEALCERSIRFLETIKPEQNVITKRFGSLNFPLTNAADSQSIIQLKREYCELKKCLHCRIGHKLLTTR